MKYAFPLLTLLFIGLSSSSNAEEPTSFQLTPEQISNLELTYDKVKARVLHHSVTGVGVIHLNENRVFDIAPRISGFVTEDFVAIGDEVQAGDKLFRLQSAELSEMVSAYVKAEQEMNFATAAAVQEERLADKGLSSKEQVKLKQLESQQAIAAHARALQPLKLLNFTEATVHQYLANVEGSDYTSYTVASLGDGEVIEKSIRLGAVVDPNATLLTVADLSELWVDFSVSLRDADLVSIDGKVEVTSSVCAKVSTATVVYVAPLADEENRMVKIRAVLPNKDHEWRPGTPVKIETKSSLDEERSVLSVPSSSILDTADGKAVFRTDGNGSFALTPVTILSNDGIVAEIGSGVTDGDTVVNNNAAQLKGHLEMTASE